MDSGEKKTTKKKQIYYPHIQNTLCSHDVFGPQRTYSLFEMILFLCMGQQYNNGLIILCIHDYIFPFVLAYGCLLSHYQEMLGSVISMVAHPRPHRKTATTIFILCFLLPTEGKETEKKGQGADFDCCVQQQHRQTTPSGQRLWPWHSESVARQGEGSWAGPEECLRVDQAVPLAE